MQHFQIPVWKRSASSATVQNMYLIDLRYSLYWLNYKCFNQQGFYKEKNTHANLLASLQVSEINEKCTLFRSNRSIERYRLWKYQQFFFFLLFPPPIPIHPVRLVAHFWELLEISVSQDLLSTEKCCDKWITAWAKVLDILRMLWQILTVSAVSIKRK